MPVDHVQLCPVQKNLTSKISREIAQSGTFLTDKSAHGTRAIVLLAVPLPIPEEAILQVAGPVRPEVPVLHEGWLVPDAESRATAFPSDLAGCCILRSGASSAPDCPSSQPSEPAAPERALPQRTPVAESPTTGESPSVVCSTPRSTPGRWDYATPPDC